MIRKLKYNLTACYDESRRTFTRWQLNTKYREIVDICKHFDVVYQDYFAKNSSPIIQKKKNMATCFCCVSSLQMVFFATSFAVWNGKLISVIVISYFKGKR